MPTEKKLRALQKTFELEENRALAARLKVDEVVGQRQAAVLELHGKREELLESMRRLRNEQRSRALKSGDGIQLAAIGTFGKRLEKELAELNELIEAREKELASANERLQAADEELIAARLEKKRVERLLDRREFTERIRDVASEEALADELSHFRRRKDT